MHPFFSSATRRDAVDNIASLAEHSSKRLEWFEVSVELADALTACAQPQVRLAEAQAGSGEAPTQPGQQ